MPLSQRLSFLVTGLAILCMIAVTVIWDMTFNNQPLQVRELAGRNVSMDKLADVFLGMDQIAAQNHYHRLWTYNGIIFLSAILLIRCLKDAGKK